MPHAFVTGTSMGLGRPDAPFRIPVGAEAGDWVRDHAQGVIDQVAQARAFLEAYRAD